ncbi:MAG TPA: SRPBCC domain-containing protein [Flavisolibacter sp.]|nr:SRPBCC domain-containing protein [Flavisolibacter sp.]
MVGPKGFTNTFHEFDLRTGGHWKFTMHGPDGGNYPNESVFVEIKEPERIILDHVSKPFFQLTARFEEVDNNKTELTFEQLFPTIEEYNKVKGFAIDANEENMDRLADVLQNMKSRTNL